MAASSVQAGQGPHPAPSAPPSSLNLNVRGMSQSATVAINDHSNLLRAQGRMVTKLGFGQSPFPVPASVVASLREHAAEKDYLPVAGLPALRDAVAAYHRRRHGIECSGDDVLIGPGSKELMFLLQLVYYGDLVIPTPAWVSYAPQASLIGRRVSWLAGQRAHDWKLQAGELDALCANDDDRPRVVILNYPSNPTGCTYDDGELQALAEVARRRRVVLLSDEIYGELHHDGRHQSMARYYPEGTIVSSGLSKWCGAGGWRLGTFVFPRQLRRLRDAMAAVASETYTSTSAPIQYAAVRAFAGGEDIERYLRSARRILRSLGRWSAARLRSAGIDVAEPSGAFYLLPDFSPRAERLRERGVRTCSQLCARLLEDTGVAILPGEAFGRAPSELLARLAYVDFDGARALAAVAPEGDDLRDDEVIALAGDVTAAIDRICDWVA